MIDKTKPYNPAFREWNIGDKFRLTSQATEFKVSNLYEAAGFIPTVVGVTRDGRFMTHARIADVIKL
jgi:hypothetical protein